MIIIYDLVEKSDMFDEYTVCHKTSLKRNRDLKNIELETLWKNGKCNQSRSG